MTANTPLQFGVFSLALFSALSFSSGVDIIRQSKSITDGDLLISSGGTFTLGFFSPDGSTKRYLGIWFSVSNDTIVWVANRENPLNNSSGILLLDGNGNLVVTDKTTKIYWSTNKSTSLPMNAILLDTGNLVLIQENNPNGKPLWQSFDYPTDTLLPGMKVGVDYRTGQSWKLTSWKNESDPSPGPYTYMIDTRGVMQPFTLNNTQIVYRSGPWNGIKFSGNKAATNYKNYVFTLLSNEAEKYYRYDATDGSILRRLVVESAGVIRRYEGDKLGTWNLIWSAPDENKCDNYAYCGPNSVCNIEASFTCGCFDGFEPKNLGEWSKRNFSSGCVRKTKIGCGDEVGFLPVKGLKLPDTVNATGNRDWNIEECREGCLKNCSCTAYAKANITDGGRGCIMWFGDLIDVRTLENNEPDLNLRLAKSDVDAILGKPPKEKKTGMIIGITLGGAFASLFLALIGYWVWRQRTNRNVINAAEIRSTSQNTKYAPPEEPGDLALYDFSTLALATNNFSIENKIGSGGFGDVYKGILRDGQIVAVKRLCFQSGERISEFMTEVDLIAKLQHRNLVRLLGCCTEEGERLLIYEYVPNRSLDFFLFGDEEKRRSLGWEKRLSVIIGVARGLLYLHQDSRLKVIHRDLKAANILLDEDMNAKISDFGTATIFERDQIEVITTKVVGTLGYMSPEYRISGNVSEKSDVFSFGVLVLEIISGRRNKLMSKKDYCMELLANAWTMWAENQIHRLLDSALRLPTQIDDVIKSIKVGLLCVQESADDRPTMQEVVFMLANKDPILPNPEKPGFFLPTTLSAASRWFTIGSESPVTGSALTVTALEGR